MHLNSAFFLLFCTIVVRFLYFCVKLLDMNQLIEYSTNLLKQVDTKFVRYLHNEINWNNRLIGIIGARGVGKTTLVLQYIKQSLDKKKALYVTAEDLYFSTHTLIELATEFVNYGGKYLVIDEIHKYEKWSKELKLIYDLHPNLQVIFTGSSVLDIKKGNADLSRRAIIYFMKGLSFREYLGLFHQINLPTYSLTEILQVKTDFSSLETPIPYFSAYLKSGYYPFSLEDDFEIRLRQIINQTMEVDIPFFAGMNISTARKIKHLLSIIATSVPFKPNFSKIAEIVGASRNNIADYLNYLEEAGLIMQISLPKIGIRSIGKTEKIYLENTNLAKALSEDNTNVGTLRETFFLNQVSVKHTISLSAKVDFQVDDFQFEIGGKNKKKKQIENIPNSYIVKDDIINGFGNVIPLWHFGFLY